MGRVAVDFGVGQGAKRSADIRSDLGQTSNPERLRGQNQRNPGGREAFHFFKSLLRCLRRRDWFGDDSARTQALNFVSLESEFLENFVVVFAKIGRALRRYFR